VVRGEEASAVIPSTKYARQRDSGNLTIIENYYFELLTYFISRIYRVIIVCRGLVGLLLFPIALAGFILTVKVLVVGASSNWEHIA
jgi:hypothetical protein